MKGSLLTMGLLASLGCGEQQNPVDSDERSAPGAAEAALHTEFRAAPGTPALLADRAANVALRAARDSIRPELRLVPTHAQDISTILAERTASTRPAATEDISTAVSAEGVAK
jgi:hypothetical protein